jgi:hypothetical protein
MIAKEYEVLLKKHLSLAQYLLLVLLVGVLQRIQCVKLETLADALPLPIRFESRRKKVQRFLDLSVWKLEEIWLQWVQLLVSQHWQKEKLLYVAMDRTSWGCINILMVSLIWRGRAWPLYWCLLDKKGSSNLAEQQQVLSPVIEMLGGHHLVILGDREFCSVKLGKWLSERKTYFCLRQKQDTYVESESVFVEMRKLGLSAGMSLFLNEVNVTKKKGYGKFNVACKWKRKYRGFAPEEAWYILTNFSDLETGIKSYQKRFCIEEMFRDFKGGGYQLEATKVEGNRLHALIILIAIAYTSASLQGVKIQRKGIQEYVGRIEKPKGQKQRHSSFYIGLHAYNWVGQWQEQWEMIEQLMQINRHKVLNYRQGLRAMELVLSTL